MKTVPIAATRVLVVLVAAALALTGCSGAGAGGTDAGPPPEWIAGVYPEQGATVAVPDAVEVRHRTLPIDERVRLLIDGVDVTAYADIRDGIVRYDVAQRFVDLGAGRHTATAERVLLPTDDVGFPEDTVDLEVLESYTWEFRTG
jgi:hypothetical protein